MKHLGRSLARQHVDIIRTLSRLERAKARDGDSAPACRRRERPRRGMGATEHSGNAEPRETAQRVMPESG
jgi:hypothetical protein